MYRIYTICACVCVCIVCTWLYIWALMYRPSTCTHTWTNLGGFYGFNAPNNFVQLKIYTVRKIGQNSMQNSSEVQEPLNLALVMTLYI